MLSPEKIEKLKSANTEVSASELAEVHEAMGSADCVCETICAWIIKKAAGAGTCLAGAAALGGIFTLAEVVFFPEGEEILVPLEVVVEAAWETVCEEIGCETLGKEADKYAKLWCQEAGFCK